MGQKPLLLQQGTRGRFSLWYVFFLLANAWRSNRVMPMIHLDKIWNVAFLVPFSVLRSRCHHVIYCLPATRPSYRGWYCSPAYLHMWTTNRAYFSTISCFFKRCKRSMLVEEPPECEICSSRQVQLWFIGGWQSGTDLAWPMKRGHPTVKWTCYRLMSFLLS